MSVYKYKQTAVLWSLGPEFLFLSTYLNFPLYIPFETTGLQLTL